MKAIREAASFAILYSGFHSDTFVALLSSCRAAGIPFGAVAHTGLWRQELTKLPFDLIRIYSSNGQSFLFKNTDRTQVSDPPIDTSLFFATSGSSGGFKWVFLGWPGTVHLLQALTRILNLKPSDCLAVTPPPFHCFGTVVGLLLAEHAGCKAAWMAGYDARTWLKLCADRGCTHLLGVPTVFEDWLAIPRSARVLGRLKGGIIAGAPIQRSLFLRAIAELGMDELTIGYGMTEMGPAVCHTEPGYLPTMDYEIGDPIEGTRLRIEADGEAWVSGPQACLATSLGSSRKWLPTGDLIEKVDGRHVFRGRTIEVLNQGGEKLSLLEVEQKLSLSFPSSRFLAFSVSNPRLGQSLGVAIQGAQPAESLIRATIAREFGTFFSNCVITRVLDFPRLPSGKITRNPEAINMKKGAYL